MLIIGSFSNPGMLGAFILVAVGSSGILKGKQKVGVTFISDKLSGIDFTKFSKLTMKYIQKMACAVSIFQKVLVSNMYLCSSKFFIMSTESNKNISD